MNKNRIDALIPKAYEALRHSGIVNNKNEIKKTFRGYISSFGASVAMGSLKSAIAFYSQKSGAVEDRQKLMQIIYCLVSEEAAENVKTVKQTALFEAVDNGLTDKDEIYDAAIAIKLAMNMYTLIN